MKRIILSLLAAVTILTSCSQSKERLVDKAMSEYVANNFNDPNDFKDLISIELQSKSNTDSMQSLVLGCVENFLLLDNEYTLIETKLAKILDMPKDDNRYDKSSKEDLEAFMKGFYLTNEVRSSNDFQNVVSYTYELKELIESNGFEPYDCDTYIVKVRVNVNGRLQIKNFYATFDNINNDIVIRDHGQLISEYPEFYIDIFTKADLINDVCEKYLNALKIYRPAFNKLLNDNGISIN